MPAALLTVLILARGFEVRSGGEDGREFRTVGPITTEFDLQNLSASREFRAEVERLKAEARPDATQDAR